MKTKIQDFDASLQKIFNAWSHFLVHKQWLFTVKHIQISRELINLYYIYSPKKYLDRQTENFKMPYENEIKNGT